MEALVDVKELTGLLRVSRATVYRLMDRGLPYLKVGAATRFDPNRVMAWLEEDSATAGEEETILEVGDYRCLGCGWVGHVDKPRPLSGVWCPECNTAGQVERI